MMMVMVIDPAGNPQIVANLDGCAGWTVAADPLPADYFDRPYRIENGVLVPDLAAARARQRAMINAGRDAAQDGGAETPSGRFDSASRSREFLNGAVVAAQIALAQGQPFSINWTLANNNVVTLDAPGIIAAGLAVAAHVDAMHSRARVLKSRIDAATTLAGIAAITWTVAD